MTFYIIIGVPAFLIVMLVVVARVEKRMVWPYGTPAAQPQFPDSSGYASQRIDQALTSGFSFFGWAADLKGPRYGVSYALLCSPERDCFVVIGVGTILRVNLRGTWIYTRGSDGRVFCTTDNQSCVEIDVARRWKSQLTPASSLTQLLQQHRKLLQEKEVTAQPFTAGRELEEFKSLRQEKYRAMSREGFITFTDESEGCWRYTYWGAFKLAVMNYTIGILRAVTGGTIPRCA